MAGAIYYQTHTYDHEGFAEFQKGSQEIVRCLWVNDWLVLKIPELELLELLIKR